MYCYKCGVKLQENEEVCPLCKSRLPFNKNSNELSAYSDKIDDLGKHIDFRYLTKFLLLVLFLSGFITVLCNFLISGKISWSIYVISAIIYLSTQVSFLYFKNKFIPAIFNLLGIEYLLFTIAYQTNGLHWYLYLVLPNIFIIWLIIILCILLFKKKKMRLTRSIAFILLFISFILITTEILIDLYSYKVINLKWSLYASFPILIVSLIVFVISFNHRLIDEIKKRIFI